MVSTDLHSWFIRFAQACCKGHYFIGHFHPVFFADSGSAAEWPSWRQFPTFIQPGSGRNSTIYNVNLQKGLAHVIKSLRKQLAEITLLNELANFFCYDKLDLWPTHFDPHNNNFVCCTGKDYAGNFENPYNFQKLNSHEQRNILYINRRIGWTKVA